jgi:hypothetical protein
MTPAIAPPPEYYPPTRSAAFVVPAPQYVRAEVDVFESDFPDGIDYDRWAGIVDPSPRDGFADRLDLIDLFED